MFGVFNFRDLFRRIGIRPLADAPAFSSLGIAMFLSFQLCTESLYLKTAPNFMAPEVI
jgi:hypothetical protein